VRHGIPLLVTAALGERCTRLNNVKNGRPLNQGDIP